MSEDAANHTIQFLSGESFCNSINNTLEEIEICQDFVESFMPSALVALFEALDAEKICIDVYEVC